MKLRRVVSGARQGRSVVVEDGPPPKVFGGDPDPVPGGYIFAEIWATPGPCPDRCSPRDLASELVAFGTELSAGETRFRLVQFPAGMDSPMHTTPTIDYITVVDGEIDLEFEDGDEVHLTRGDTVAQRGVAHAWHNRTDQPFQMAVVMIGYAAGVPASI